MSLSKLLIIPLLIATIGLICYAHFVDSIYAPYILIPFLPMALIYIMSPEIDWWWSQKNPPDIPSEMAELLDRVWPPYQALDTAGKQRYRNKIAMFIRGNEWVPQVWEEIPYDVQVGIAAQAVLPLLNTDSWIYPKYETIVVYPLAFMSPDFPFNHDHELNHEDKCLIFNADFIMRQFMQGNTQGAVLEEYSKIQI